jgi:hypothetical protein
MKSCGTVSGMRYDDEMAQRTWVGSERKATQEAQGEAQAGAGSAVRLYWLEESRQRSFEWTLWVLDWSYLL